MNYMKSACDNFIGGNIFLAADSFLLADMAPIELNCLC